MPQFNLPVSKGCANACVEFIYCILMTYTS
jgi:hypothetical protein